MPEPRHSSFQGLVELLGVDDLARALGLPTRRAVYNRIHRGTLPPPIRVGGSLRWDPRDVQEWLDAHRGEVSR